MPLNGEIKWVLTGQVLWVRREEGCFWGWGGQEPPEGWEGSTALLPLDLGNPPICRPRRPVVQQPSGAESFLDLPCPALLLDATSGA